MFCHAHNFKTHQVANRCTQGNMNQFLKKLLVLVQQNQVFISWHNLVRSRNRNSRAVTKHRGIHMAGMGRKGSMFEFKWPAH